MSVCRKLPDGTIQKIAGHTILLDANVSEVREGQAIFTNPTWGMNVDVTFSDPMPDTDYKVILEYPNAGQSWSSNSTPADVAIHNKTTTGFRITMWPVGTVNKVYINWTAFKLIKLDGYTALQNKVNNPDAVPTENSTNLVESGGVWEAIKNASSVFVGTRAEWTAEPDQTIYDIAVITDEHKVLSVDHSTGDTEEQANLNKIFRGTQAEWDALTPAEKDEWEEAQIIDDQYIAVPGTLIVAHDKVVAVADWQADATYAGYGYKAEISMPGVTADYSPDVRFSFADINSGTFAPVADAGTNKVIIYASTVPAAAVTIPVIICTLMSV